MPFENQTEDTELESLASNTPGELHQRLSTFGKEIIADVSEAEEAAGPRYDATLSGSISREKGMLKLHLTLHRKSGPKLTLPPFSQLESDDLGLYSEAAIAIARECGVNVSASDEARLRSGDKVGAEAWILYCKGLEEMYKVTPESSQLAKEHFQKEYKLP